MNKPTAVGWYWVRTDDKEVWTMAHVWFSEEFQSFIVNLPARKQSLLLNQFGNKCQWSEPILTPDQQEPLPPVNAKKVYRCLDAPERERGK